MTDYFFYLDINLLEWEVKIYFQIEKRQIFEPLCKNALLF